MTEVRGYHSAARVYDQSVEIKARNSDKKLDEKNSTARLEGLKGIEVTLSSNQEPSDFDTYENLNKPTEARLSPTEQRAIDDLEYDQRNRK